jgi:hypothetical protein
MSNVVVCTSQQRLLNVNQLHLQCLADHLCLHAMVFISQCNSDAAPQQQQLQYAVAQSDPFASHSSTGSSSGTVPASISNSSAAYLLQQQQQQPDSSSAYQAQQQQSGGLDDGLDSLLDFLGGGSSR